MNYREKIRARRMETESGRIALAIDDILRLPFKERMEVFGEMNGYPGWALFDNYRIEFTSDKFATIITKINPDDEHDQIKILPDIRFSNIDQNQDVLSVQSWHTI